MANNLSEVTPKLMALGIDALREFSITPRLVNREYEPIAGQQGSSIDVSIPAPIAVQAVTPGPTPPSTADIAPTSVPIPLDQWFEGPFTISDKEELQIMRGFLPQQALEAVKAVANKIDIFVLDLYTKFYGYHGTAGTTPFGTPGVKDATGIRKILQKQLAPQGDRHVLLDPDAEAAALGLREFQDRNFSGSIEAILEGNLNRKLGFDWWMNQNVPTHTAGGGSGYLVNDGAGLVVGAKTAIVDTGTGTLVVGDIIDFAGHDQTYVITAAYAGGAGTIAFEPGIQTAVANNAAITLRADHVVNLAFQRNAIAFATRPLINHGSELGVITESAFDELTGVAMRLEVTHEHKRRRFSFDALWGAEVIYRELGARLAG